MKRLSILLALAALCGCTSTSVNRVGNDISVTTRGVGVNIAATSAPGTPAFQVGIISSSIHITPVVTNQVFIARSFNAVDVQNSWNPLNSAFNESMGYGDVQVITNAQGSAIIPKFAPAMIVTPAK